MAPLPSVWGEGAAERLVGACVEDVGVGRLVRDRIQAGITTPTPRGVVVGDAAAAGIRDLGQVAFPVIDIARRERSGQPGQGSAPPG